MKLCECGCGGYVTKEKNRFIRGHHPRVLIRGKKHRENISNRMKGPGNPMYKGAKDCLYSFWSKKITIDETRCNNEKIEVRCKYCNKWFTPTPSQMDNRYAQLKKGNDGCNFYCSDNCRNLCSDYFQVLWPKYYKPYENRNKNSEVSSELRKMVMDRDNWECQKCESKENLECHHIDPVSENPIFSNDIDSCITLCSECHKEIHMNIEGCGYNELKRC